MINFVEGILIEAGTDAVVAVGGAVGRGVPTDDLLDQPAAPGRHGRRHQEADHVVGLLGDEDPAVRNVVLFGLDRLADHTLIPDLEKAIEADKAAAKKDKKKAKMLKGAVYTYELMMAKLSHKQ